MTELSENSPELNNLCERLRELAPTLEQPNAWPEAQFQELAKSGVLGWIIPEEFGGQDFSSSQMMQGYQKLAGACLTTTFVMTQRNGACQRLRNCQNEGLKAELLPELCAGNIFATVGISHLTTSRRHIATPAVRATVTDEGIVMSGTVPWVTGAGFADWIVTGGTCDDGREVLVALNTSLPGVTRQESARLLALNASQTASVELAEVLIDQRYLIAGPVAEVMKQGLGGGAGSLTTSALAAGHSAAALEYLIQEMKNRPDLSESVLPLQSDYERLSADLLQACETGSELPVELSAESLRQRANSLALRMTQAYLAASKGAGFVQGHPAERLVREAMFFLVWSCPQPVLAAALREFACVNPG